MTEQDQVLDAYDALIKERDALDENNKEQRRAIEANSNFTDTLARENERLREALTRITVEHCAYKLDSNSQYEIGVVDGHRCAANIAVAALANAPTPNDKGK